MIKINCLKYVMTIVNLRYILECVYIKIFSGFSLDNLFL